MKQRLKIIVNEKPYDVEVDDPNASPLAVTVNGKQYTVTVETPESKIETNSTPKPVATRKVSAVAADPMAKKIKAPMPGTILDISVKPGDNVAHGQQLCALEAMKMKSAIRSPHDGVIATVNVQSGQSVAHGDVLMTFA
ncbi:MAG: biotin/lipoyl-containing protein [Chloroflexota bacterium]